MADARNNELPRINGTYILMQDVDRCNDIDYENIEDAREALRDAQDYGCEDMWIAYVDEDGNLQFEEGESA